MAENNSISLKEVKRKRKLYAAFANLKLSLFEAQRMCVVDERIETAAWAFNLKDKTGKILIGAKILDSWSVHEIEKAIEHEFLHFSVYSAFRNQYEALNMESPEMFNITSDGAIWKAINETGGQYALRGIFKKIRIDEPDNPFLLVLNPNKAPDHWQARRSWRRAETILGAAKTQKLQEIWKDVHKDANIYKATVALKELAKKTSEEDGGSGGSGGTGGKSGKPGDQQGSGGGGGGSQPQDQQQQQQQQPQQPQQGQQPQPKPEKTASDYAKEILDKEDPFKELSEEYVVRRIPEGYQIDEDDIDSEPDAMAGAVENFLDEHKRDFENFSAYQGGGFSDMMSKAFKIFKVSKKKITTDTLRKFIERMKVKQTLEECSSTIKTGMLPSVSRTQPFIYNLSRLGITYQAIGLSGKIIPLWWNKTPENAKPKLAIYVDTSGSMDTFKGETVFLIGDLISDIPSKIFWFSGDVGEMSAKEFAAGKYKGGGSTSFDAVMEHFLKLRDYNDCIIISDGESHVCDENVKKIKRSRKSVYACYMVEDYKRYGWQGNYTDTLKSVAKSSFIIKKKRSK